MTIEPSPICRQVKEAINALSQLFRNHFNIRMNSGVKNREKTALISHNPS
jgi:hypothetical protein